MRAADDGARHRTDHFERVVVAISDRVAFSKGRLRRLARTGAETDLNGDRTILGKISKWDNRYLRVLFVQAAWVVLVRPKTWERYMC